MRSEIPEIKDVPGLPLSVSECGTLVICRRTYRAYKLGGANGYRQVQKVINKKRRTFMVHRLVAMAFLGTPEGYEKLDVNHKDADKSNNRYTNLEWCTHQENMCHGRKLKLFKPGPGIPVGYKYKTKNKRNRKEL